MSVEMESIVSDLIAKCYYGRTGSEEAAPRRGNGACAARRRSCDAHARFVAMKFAVRKRRAPSIIIVSLVDILTILLIFFVVSTTFKKDQPEVQINLPESKTATKASAELEHAIVSVSENDEVGSTARRSASMSWKRPFAICRRPQSRPRFASRQEGLVRHDHQSNGRAETGGREKFARFHPRREMKLPIAKYGDPILRAQREASRESGRSDSRTCRQHAGNDARGERRRPGCAAGGRRRFSSPCSMFRRSKIGRAR